MNSITGLDTIGIEVKTTDRCNQGCFHCVNDDCGPSGADINHQLFIERLRELASHDGDRGWKVKEVRITGGEPLLNMPGLIAIAECCSALGIKSGINTNGLLLTDSSIPARLRDSGIQIVKVSLDSLNPEVFESIRGRKSSLSKVLDGISISVKSGFEVIVRFTITALNRDELLPCYQFACEAGATRFQVKPLIEVGLGALSGAGLAPGDLSAAIRELSLARKDPSSCIPEILCTPPREAFGMSAKACGSINKIYVSVNGDICSCNFVPGRKLGSMNTMSFSGILERRQELEGLEYVEGEPVLAGCPRYAGRW